MLRIAAFFHARPKETVIMSKQPDRRSRAKLQDTDEMAQDFYTFGLEGLPYWLIGRHLAARDASGDREDAS